MSLELQAILIFNIILAALLSGVIGLDRERKRDRKKTEAAGLRTHILVGVGACLFTVLSRHAFPPGDPSRVAAQVVSGIGFLGAGVIFVRNDKSVKNLTTAASIWATAAIGMAVGVGAWLLAMASTVIVWVILVVVSKIEVRAGF